MLEIFDTDPQFDPTISELSFSDKSGIFTLEIVAKNNDAAIALKKRITSLKGIYEMDSPTYQNFKVELLENSVVKITGNIMNALKILTETKLISSDLSSKIAANKNVSDFLQKTTSFVLPENQNVLPTARTGTTPPDKSTPQVQNGSSTKQQPTY